MDGIGSLELVTERSSVHFFTFKICKMYREFEIRNINLNTDTNSKRDIHMMMGTP